MNATPERKLHGSATYGALKMFDITGMERPTEIDKAGKIAESASKWIWKRKRRILIMTQTAEPARRGISQHHKCAICGSDTFQPLKESCPKRWYRPLRNKRAFQGRNYILRNFCPCSVRVIERRFRSAEHAYKYIKARWYSRKDLAEKIYKQPNACVAKTLAKVLPEVSW